MKKKSKEQNSVQDIGRIRQGVKRDIIDNISYEIIVKKNENHNNASLRRLGRKGF